jgi:hypothetical protein
MAEPVKQRSPDTNGHQLKVIQINDEEYFVESSKGKVCYRVSICPEGHSCTCGDFAANPGKDPHYVCKHIRVVLDQYGTIPRIDFNQNVRPKLDERFLTNIQGKDFVIYSGLLDLAHQKGLRSIKVEALQFPTKDNGHEAICKAEVESLTGDIYVEWGDANPNNVNRKIAAHILRMAATRAKARALRDYTNIGITCLEELGEIDEVIPDPKKKANGNVVPISDAQKQKSAKGNGKAKPPAPKTEPETEPSHMNTQVKTPGKDHQQDSNESADGPGPSSAQLKAMENLAKRRGISSDEMEEMAQQMFGTSFRNINSSEAASFIRNLQQSS